MQGKTIQAGGCMNKQRWEEQVKAAEVRGLMINPSSLIEPQHSGSAMERDGSSTKAKFWNLCI